MTSDCEIVNLTIGTEKYMNNYINYMSTKEYIVFCKFIKRQFILNLVNDNPIYIDYNTLKWLQKQKSKHLILVFKLFKLYKNHCLGISYTIEEEEFLSLSNKLKYLIFNASELSLELLCIFITGLLNIQICIQDILDGFEYIEWKKTITDDLQKLSIEYKNKLKYNETKKYINWLTNED